MTVLTVQVVRPDHPKMLQRKGLTLPVSPQCHLLAASGQGSYALTDTTSLLRRFQARISRCCWVAVSRNSALRREYRQVRARKWVDFPRLQRKVVVAREPITTKRRILNGQDPVMTADSAVSCPIFPHANWSSSYSVKLPQM